MRFGLKMVSVNPWCCVYLSQSNQENRTHAKYLNKSNVIPKTVYSDEGRGWEARDRTWEATQGFAPAGRGYRYQARESKGAGGVTWVQEVEPPARGWSWPGLCGGSWCQEKHTVTTRDTENGRKILPSPFLPPSKLTTASFQWPHPTQHLLVANPTRSLEQTWAKMDCGGGRPRDLGLHTSVTPKLPLLSFHVCYSPSHLGRNGPLGNKDVTSLC